MPTDNPRRTRRTRTDAERLPPHSIEAEQGLLGSILLDPAEVLPQLLSDQKDVPGLFYDLRHRELAAAILHLHEVEHVGVDLITLSNALKKDGKLDGFGGLAYLASLQDSTPSAANWKWYLDIIKDKALLRSGLRVCADWMAKAYAEEEDAGKLVDALESGVLKVSTESATDSTVYTAKVLVQRSLESIEACYNQQGAPLGIPTGFHDLDKKTNGLKAGEMIVIAARPSIGKTSLAMNIAEHVAVNEKMPVGVFSLEMTAESLMTRTLCGRARVNLRKIQDGIFMESDYPRLSQASGELLASPLVIDDASGLSVMQLRAKARRMHQHHGIRLFVVDYLQLLHTTERRAENRQQEIADISSGIKALAKELKVPIIVLSQLNRELEKRNPGSKPRLSDLRESGSIEQDADVVGLLYKPVSEEDDAGEDVIPVNLLIAKQRNGPTGDVPLTFFRSFTRFETASKVSDKDVPPPPYTDN